MIKVVVSSVYPCNQKHIHLFCGFCIMPPKQGGTVFNTQYQYLYFKITHSVQYWQTTRFRIFPTVNATQTSSCHSTQKSLFTLRPKRRKKIITGIIQLHFRRPHRLHAPQTPPTRRRRHLFRRHWRQRRRRRRRRKTIRIVTRCWYR